MSPEARSIARQTWSAEFPLSVAWRSALAWLVPAWLALVAIFLPDWAAMARQWWDISTYNHILLIPVILAWLVWQQAGELAKLEPVTWWPGLVLVGGAGLVWLLGAFSGLDLARQLGAVLVLIAASLAILGPRVGAGLAFPLGYILLLVPFGDEFVPALQTITTAITVTLVEWSAIPASVNGVFIDTPAGLFEVAEACSGVKFLIAMVAFAILLAHVCFVSWPRRALLLAVCVVVPVLANGVRAFATIYAAQIVGIEAAAGFDHIVYGWFFFALVLGLVLAGAWKFFDRPAGDPLVRAERIAASAMLARAGRLRMATVPAVAALFLVVAGSQAWARAADSLTAQLAVRIALPEVAGWRRVDYAPAVWWEPRAGGAGHRLLGSYEDSKSGRVDVFLAVYSRQGEGSEAGGYGQGALMPQSEWSWLAPGPGVPGAKSERLLAAGEIERLAVTRYRTGEITTGSNVRLKLAGMADRLLLQKRATMMLILSAEETTGKPAADAIARFSEATGSLDRWMDRIAGLE